MTIYQEEMMRNLPKLGCAGKYDETDASLAISYNGVHLCKQLMDGTLVYSDDIERQKISTIPSFSAQHFF